MTRAGTLAEARGPAAPPLRHATLQAALAQAARSETGLTFLDSREQETFLSFRDLHARARRAAFALRERGVRPGDRVAIILPTGVDFMDAFFGTLYAGAVPVPLYPPVRLGRLEEFHARTARMLAVCGARLVLSDARVSRLLGVSVERARPALGHATVAELNAAAGPNPAREFEHAANADELALIQFSSGSTVEPKPVALTHRNVLSNAAAIDTFLPEQEAAAGAAGPRQAGVSWLPLYHDMGLIGCLLLAVTHPGPLTLLGPELFLARPALWLRAISRARATISVAPNFAYGLCVKRIRDEELAGVDLSSWKLALNGAEPIAPAVLQRFAERFAKFGFDARALLPVYGLSEASLAVTFAQPGRGARTLRVSGDRLAQGFAASSREAGARELVSVGTPLPGMSLRIAAPDGTVLGERAIGRVLVSGPSVMSGYFGNEAATSLALQGGWLDTGDQGFLDEGELYLCGRAKDLVILRGRNHAPQEFEDALDGLAGVRPGCAVAVGFVPAGGDSEELALLLEREGPVDEAALIESVRGRLVERTSIRPHTVRVLPPGSLPRTSSGKLRRAEALRQLGAGELAPPRDVTLFGMAREAARSLAAFTRLRLWP